MYCKKCGNVLVEGHRFCVNCGYVKDNIESDKHDKNAFFFSNIMIFMLYLLSTVLLIILVLINLSKLGIFSDYNNTGSLMIMPLMVISSILSFVWPNIVGLILSFINFKSNKNNSLLFLLILSIFCLSNSIKAISDVLIFDSFLGYAAIIINVLIVIIFVLKIVLLFKKN